MMDEFRHGWGMGWGMVFGVIILILVVWLITRSVNYRRDKQNTSEPSALETLKKRYARGEIDKQEFESRKKDLM